MDALTAMKQALEALEILRDLIISLEKMYVHNERTKVIKWLSDMGQHDLAQDIICGFHDQTTYR